MLSILCLRYAVATLARAEQLIKSTLQYLCLRCASEEPLADVCYLTFQFSVCDAETSLFDFCGFLSVSVVVLEFAVVGFVLVLWGLFVCGGVGSCGSCPGGGGVRRRLAVLCCTTFYKLDLRFT
jgi:hypothetical protein